jgi:hypothetical protein
MMQKAAPRDNAIFDKDRGYWIDALCINQENTGERNHQVAQLGSIFPGQTSCMVHLSEQVLDSCVDNSRGGPCKTCRGVFDCAKDAIYDVHEKVPAFAS